MQRPGGQHVWGGCGAPQAPRYLGGMIFSKPPPQVYCRCHKTACTCRDPAPLPPSAAGLKEALPMSGSAPPV